LGPALGAAFEDVDGVIDLPEKIFGVEESITIFARLEDNSGFPGVYEDVRYVRQ